MVVEVLNAMLLACAGAASSEAVASLVHVIDLGAVPDTWAPNGSSVRPQGPNILLRAQSVQFVTHPHVVCMCMCAMHTVHVSEKGTQIEQQQEVLCAKAKWSSMWMGVTPIHQFTRHFGIPPHSGFQAGLRAWAETK